MLREHSQHSGLLKDAGRWKRILEFHWISWNLVIYTTSCICVYVLYTYHTYTYIYTYVYICSHPRNGSILLMSAMLNGGRTAFMMTPCAFVLLGSLEAAEHSCRKKYMYMYTMIDIIADG